MNKNDFFAKPSTIWFFTVIVAILAATSIYFCVIDDFAHSLVLFFDYLLLLILVIVLGRAFEKGEKELVKIAAASIYTLTFLVFAKTFVDIIYLNNIYLFSENYLATFIGIITILIFLLFICSYVCHFSINVTNNSSSKNVSKNRVYLIIITILCLINAVLIYSNDNMSGRKIEWFLIVTYVAYAGVAFLLLTIETLINNFRLARESGKLESFATELVGEKAAATALGKKKNVKKVVVRSKVKKTKKIIKTKKK